MKRRALVLILALCLTLGGCSRLFDGRYVSVQPHEQQVLNPDGKMSEAADYEELCEALISMVLAGAEEGVISVSDYRQEQVKTDMNKAIVEIRQEHPVAAYAVRDITFELGTRTGAALAVTVDYIHDRAEIQKISRVSNMDQAISAISGSLNRCDAGLVMQIDQYEDTDFVQVVEQYAFEYPELVMETPQVAVNIYPEAGDVRVVEMKYTYRTSRDTLKNMQNQVQPVFDSAALYVSGDADVGEKYSQLFSFLMERYDYEYAASVTPAYSLLRLGVGDSKAFATIYAAMCRYAELECQVVSGTCKGESRYWNIICDDGIYYHVDLLAGEFKKRKDWHMDDYVWDRSAYPPCGVEMEN